MDYLYVQKKNWFIKRWFLQGIVVTLPAIVTIIVLYYGIIYTDAALWFLWDLLPWDLLPWTIAKPSFPGLGLVVFVVTIIFLGALTESFIVDKAIRLFNFLMSKVPFIRNIYSTVLKVAQNLFGNQSNFSSVVLIEYPKKGVYAIAFKTSDSPDSFCQLTNKKLVNVFFPTTPNPTSGYYLLIPEDDLINVDITTEEAFKLIISAGIVQKK